MDFMFMNEPETINVIQEERRPTLYNTNHKSKVSQDKIFEQEQSHLLTSQETSHKNLVEVHSQHSSQKYGIPKIDSLHSINSKLGINTQLDTDGSIHKPKLDHLNQVSVSCGVVDMTQMINKTPQNEELFQQSLTAHNNSVMHPAARDARSVSPALSPSVARHMKTYFSSLKTVIKRKPIIRKTTDQSPQKL